MAAFQLIMMILSQIASARAGGNRQASTAVLEAINDLTALYRKLRDRARQDAELTPEQDAAVVAAEKAEYATSAWNPNLNI